MDRGRRKELMEQYRQARPQMGVFAVRCAPEQRIYLGAAQNLPAVFNSFRFQMNNNALGGNRNITLDWHKYGADGLVMETLEVLEYDKDNDLKTDYREDLAVLKDFWREKLTAEGWSVENFIPKDR